MSPSKPSSPLDRRLLYKDARRRQEERLTPKTQNSFAAVRAVMPTIRRLRAKNVGWAEIAASLGDQGITQGSGETLKPITRERLTSIVTQIERADRAKAAKQVDRAGRSDLASSNKKPPLQKNQMGPGQVSLSAELSVKSTDVNSQASDMDDEETIRRRALEKLKQEFLKPDQEG